MWSRSTALLVLSVAVACPAQAPDTPAAPRPNILLALADDASYPHMSAYGCRWVRTPAFDRIAREGLLFTRAYTPNAKCAPSRACLLTGRNPWQLKAACNHICYFPPEFPTYPEVLAARGYFVGSTAKGWGPGIARDAQGRERQLAGRPFNQQRRQPPTAHIAAFDYAGNFRDFLAAAPADTPWCFWYGAVEPHRPYQSGAGASVGGRSITDIDAVPSCWPDTETVRTDLLDYAFEIEHFDQHLGDMLRQIEARGELDNTLVVVTSDNGMPFPRAKGQVYELSNHMPLAIRWPRGIRQPGRAADAYVSFVDFAPTFLEVAGVDGHQAGMAPTAGCSLTDVFQSEHVGRERSARDHVLVGKERHDIGRPHDWGYPIRGIFKQDLLYLRNFEPRRWPAGNPETGYLNCDGSPTKSLILRQRREGGDTTFWQLAFGRRPEEELYDVAHDPACIVNLAGRPQYAEAQADLRAQLERELTAQEDPRMLGRGEEFEAYPYAFPAQQNFYERYLRGERLETGWVDPSDFEPPPWDEEEPIRLDGSREPPRS